MVTVSDLSVSFLSDKNKRWSHLVPGVAFSKEQCVNYVWYSGHGETGPEDYGIYLIGFFSLPEWEQKKVFASTWPVDRCSMIFLNACRTVLLQDAVTSTVHDVDAPNYEESTRNLCVSFSKPVEGGGLTVPEFGIGTNQWTHKSQLPRFLNPVPASPKISSPCVRVSAVDRPTIQIPEGDDDEGEMVVAPILGVAVRK